MAQTETGGDTAHGHTTHIGVAADDLKGILHFLGAGTASNVKEVSWLPSVVLDQVQRGHG